jgi:hypothetical protein
MFSGSGFYLRSTKYIHINVAINFNFSWSIKCERRQSKSKVYVNVRMYVRGYIFSIRGMNYTWLGITDAEKEGQWKDVGSVTTPQYFNWWSCEPDDGTSNNCAWMDYGNGKWYDYSCGRSGPYIVRTYVKR